MQNRLLPALARPSLINKLAHKTGWLRRKPKRLTPLVFSQALVACVSSGHCSLREIAIEIGLLTGRTISKQALAERFNAKGVDFLKQLVAEALRCTFGSLPVNGLDQLPGVERILIGDSSSIALDHSLADHFPGSTNNESGEKQAAHLKFQCTLDLLSGQWLQANLGPYLVPDQKTASDILDILQPGDLIIRDLGYATLDSFKAIGRTGAYYISRLPQTPVIRDRMGDRFDLQRLAGDCAKRQGNTFSVDILLGEEKRLPCRLVMIRVPKEVANERRRRIRATAKRKGRPEPTKAYLSLQNWSLYITNLSEEQAGNTQLFELYQLRWRVENIFKLCKSQTRLQKIARHKTNCHHAHMLVWAWVLLMVSISGCGVFRLLKPSPDEADPEVIAVSIFKSIERIIQWVAASLELAAAGDFAALMERLKLQQAYHDRYEKRLRISMPQRVAMALKLESGEF